MIVTCRKNRVDSSDLTTRKFDSVGPINRDYPTSLAGFFGMKQSGGGWFIIQLQERSGTFNQSNERNEQLYHKRCVN